MVNMNYKLEPENKIAVLLTVIYVLYYLEKQSVYYLVDGDVAGRKIFLSMLCLDCSIKTALVGKISIYYSVDPENQLESDWNSLRSQGIT